MDWRGGGGGGYCDGVASIVREGFALPLLCLLDGRIYVLKGKKEQQEVEAMGLCTG